MTPAEIQRLVPLVEQAKARDLAVFSATLREIEDLEQKITALHHDMQRNSLADTNNFAVIARWQNWADAEVDQLERAVSVAKQASEAARKVALRSSAKVRAVEMLLKTALKEQLQTNRRRAEQNGVPPDA